MVGELPWLPSMNVGIAAIDDDHRRLLGLMTELAGHVEAFDANRAGPAAATFLAAVDRHFALEESLMRAHGYPETERHLACHAATREVVARIGEAARTRHSVAHAATLLQELGGSYFSNLLREDGALANWMRACGVAE